MLNNKSAQTLVKRLLKNKWALLLFLVSASFLSPIVYSSPVSAADVHYSVKSVSKLSDGSLSLVWKEGSPTQNEADYFTWNIPLVEGKTDEWKTIVPESSSPIVIWHIKPSGDPNYEAAIGALTGSQYNTNSGFWDTTSVNATVTARGGEINSYTNMALTVAQTPEPPPTTTPGPTDPATPGPTDPATPGPTDPATEAC